MEIVVSEDRKSVRVGHATLAIHNRATGIDARTAAERDAIAANYEQLVRSGQFCVFNYDDELYSYVSAGTAQAIGDYDCHVLKAVLEAHGKAFERRGMIGTLNLGPHQFQVFYKSGFRATQEIPEEKVMYYRLSQDVILRGPIGLQQPINRQLDGIIENVVRMSTYLKQVK